MKFLIFGSAGMAGNMICQYLINKGYDVMGVSREKDQNIKTIQCDVRNINDVKAIIEDGTYDIVVNCIGILNQFAEDNHDEAVFLNSYFPHLLVELTKDKNTKCVFLSTDCVFSGKGQGAYTESDVPDEQSFYGRTKALGEVNDSKNLTIRTSIIGPDAKEKGIGLLNWFMKQDGVVRGYTNAIWTGITTLELAKIIEKASFENITGLVNMVHKEPISKYELLILFNEKLKQNKLIIEPFDDYYSNKSLVRTNKSFNYTVPHYEVMIEELAIWIKDNRNLYTHYNI